MAVTTIFANASKVRNVGASTWRTCSASLRPTASEAKECYIRFPSLGEYTEAESVKLTLRLQSRTAGTFALYAGDTEPSVGLSGAVRLASYTVSESNASITVDLTPYISQITTGSYLYLIIRSDSTEGIVFNYTGETANHYIQVRMPSSSVVYYCTGGVWTPCEAYFATGGVWKQCGAYFGNGGTWKELGV